MSNIYVIIKRDYYREKLCFQHQRSKVPSEYMRGENVQQIVHFQKKKRLFKSF